MASPPPPPRPSTPLAPGFRFYPTDVELVGYYLRRKVAGLPLRVDAIAEVELYRWAPWELPPLSRLRGRDRQWFFFSALDRKYDRSLRANRATAEGFWKSSGKDRPVLLDEKKVIGMKKSLVFHVGRAPNGRRTDWLMHEYRLKEDEKSHIGARGTSFVVCRVFQKIANGRHKADQFGAPLNEQEWGEAAAARELVHAGEAASPAADAAAGERDDTQSHDIEQGTTQTMHLIDFSTIGFEASSSNSSSPSKVLLAPGFRFHLTDEELVSYYLKRKMSGLPLCVDAIAEVNVYRWAPWDLPRLSRLSLDMLNTEWYFFSALDRKYAKNRLSHHNNRATAEGYWKSTGIDRPVRSRTSAEIIGMKKTLVFHAGRSPLGQRTDWVMHEYRLEDNEQNSKGSLLVLCRIYQKTGAGPRKPRALYGAPFIEEEQEDAPQDLVQGRNALAVPDVTVDAALDVGVDAAQEQNHICFSEDSEQGIPEKIYSIGSQVEIAYIRDKLPVAWYMATVIKVVGERILLVEYENMRAEDGTLLSEIVSIQYIRPHLPTLGVRNFDLLDEVEAFYNGGWWPGVIAKVNAGSRYNVKFMHWEEEIEFMHTELRLLHNWVDGQWIQASQDKSLESQNLGGPKSIGHMQLSPASNTATKRKDRDSITPSSGCGDETPCEFLICATNYEDVNSDGSTSQSQDGLQPCKKAKTGETTRDNTRLLDSKGTETSSAVKTGFDIHTPIIEEESNFRIKDVVEKCSTSPFKKIDVAAADSIAKTSSNILLGDINEDALLPDKLSQEVALFHKPHSSKEEDHPAGRSGKNEFPPITDCHQRKELASELDCRGDKEARQHTIREKRRKNCRPRKLRIIEPPLSGDPMGNQGGNKVMGLPTEGLSAAQCGTCSDNGSEAQGLFNVTASSSDVSLVETSASNVQPSEARSEAQNNIVLSAAREQSAKRALIENVEDSLPEQSPLPFEKRSFMWEPIESMKVICAMPQRPHFRPLEKYCKSFREGIAIGLMVTFSNVVNSIGKLEIADPHHKFDGILKSLLPLEVYGFDVQRVRARLMELLRMKDNHDRLVDKRSALKRLIVKEKRVKELLNVEIESIEKTSKGLEQSISHLYEGERNIFKRERENNSKLGILEIDSSRIEDALLSARHDFEAICSSMCWAAGLPFPFDTGTLLCLSLSAIFLLRLLGPFCAIVFSGHLVVALAVKYLIWLWFSYFSFVNYLGGNEKSMLNTPSYRARVETHCHWGEMMCFPGTMTNVRQIHNHPNSKIPNWPVTCYVVSSCMVTATTRRICSEFVAEIEIFTRLPNENGSGVILLIVKPIEDEWMHGTEITEMISSRWYLISLHLLRFQWQHQRLLGFAIRYEAAAGIARIYDTELCEMQAEEDYITIVMHTRG